METFVKIVNACYERGCSDLHMAGDHPIVCRKDGEVFFQKQQVLSAQYVDQLVDTLLNPRQRQQLREHWSVDLALSVEGKRLRVNVFSSHRGASLAIRFLPAAIPDLESLNLHSSLTDFCAFKSGLLLICGSTGSGKTTTIAALINEINRSRPCHVVTLEDPIEYLFTSRHAFVEQRELGKHFHSFQQGLLDVLRQAPDVIVVGEMRSPETIQLALDAAESGHLVIATMHAGTHEEAVHRMCSLSNSAEHTRLQLSQCLAGIVNQQLVYLPKLRFSVPQLSVLRNNRACATLIRENKLSQLDSMLETCKGQGMFTFAAYREDYLDGRTDFRKPALLNARSADPAPQEHSSPVFDYAARPGAAPGFGGPAAQEQVASAPQLPAGDIDDYILELERRSS